MTGRVGVVCFATPSSRSLTGFAGCLTPVLRCLTLTRMFITARDRQIVMTVGRFGQAAAGQLRAIHFHNVTQTPLDRTLKRLVEQRYLARIERRLVGGTGAGSGQYVYQLGSAGWAALERTRQYRPMRAVSYHTLAIVDAYIELLEWERREAIRLLSFTTEPDTRQVVGGVELRPDLFVEVGEIHKQRALSLWIEVDMGTERPSVIRQKLASYYAAHKSATAAELRVFPRILFVTPDSMREHELTRIIGEGREEAQTLFMVSTMADFAPLLFA